jgi:ferrous iron transport protein B
MSATRTPSKGNCHSEPSDGVAAGGIALVGNPNVGKSVMFGRLTGRYVTVSNFPGTTVDVSRGNAREGAIAGSSIIDTPGVVSIPARSEDEAVTTRVLLGEPLSAVLQVGDAKNLRRTLLLTTQLVELGLPFVLALNMHDEARTAGVEVDEGRISELLGAAVQPTVATRGEGVDAIPELLREAEPATLKIDYPDEVERAAQACESLLPPTGIAARGLALLWLAGDQSAEVWVSEHADTDALTHLRATRDKLQVGFDRPISTVLQDARLAWVDSVSPQVGSPKETKGSRLLALLTRGTTHPVFGLPILAAVLYAMYWFVGVFGAGILVGLIEEDLFGKIINPWVTTQVEALLGVNVVSELLVGDYGLWTMGMTYALALILPIVTTFFIAFSLLEDSGYLSRMAVVSNRMFKMMGLNGKAVLPMVLGLGCVTMATLTTRILDTKRERALAILLLALAVPCSAQLGVILGMLGAVSFTAGLIWLSVVLLVLFAVGAIAAKLMPGERSTLMIEMPPLRKPKLSNVATKTLTRLEWYLREVIPLFLLGTAILFVLNLTGGLAWLIEVLAPVTTGWLGLPAAASGAFVLGFLRRDFGATGLFVMHSAGQLNAEQVVVAMVTITLFIPCVASVMMIARERGAKIATATVAFVFPFAFLVGGVLHRVLTAVGWGA